MFEKKTSNFVKRDANSQDIHKHYLAKIINRQTPKDKDSEVIPILF